MMIDFFFHFQATVTKFGNPLPDRVPGKEFSYSDHNAVSVQLNLKPRSNTSGNSKCIDIDTEFHETTKEAIQVCKEAMSDLSSFKTLHLAIAGVTLMTLMGTVGYWPSSMFCDIIKIIITGLGFYSLMLGTIWYKIESNCLKARLSVLDNFCRTRIRERPNEE